MTTPVQERTFESDERLKIPRPFILRRLHSLLGFWLVFYLTQHLLVNSQAAFFFYDDGYGFVSAVNKINSLPYLKVIEILILALPFLIHGVWGIYYAWTSKLNAHPTDGSKPALPQYKRNRAFSWQRITSWLLLIGILAHVIHMRFLEYPAHFLHGDDQKFMVPLRYDPGLPLVAEKMQVKLFDQKQIDKKQAALKEHEERLVALEQKKNEESFHPDDAYAAQLAQVIKERNWLRAAQKKPLKKERVLAVAPHIGSAIFLILRETFKSIWMVLLYSILVVAATFHAFNGLWTFMIKWGITLTRRAQKRMRTLSTVLMFLVTALGLAAAWGTYWTVQFQL